MHPRNKIPALGRQKHAITTPAEAEPIIKARLAKLGLTFQQYIASLITYDCWAEKDHVLTGGACKGNREEETRLWAEIIRDFGKPDKTGSYFECRVRDFVLQKLHPGDE